MKTCSQYKNESLRTLKGRWGIAIMSCVLVIAIEIAAAVLAVQIGQGFPYEMTEMARNVISLLFAILLLPLGYGWLYITLQIARKDKPKVENLFIGFKDGKRITNTLLLRWVYVFLWSLLLVVPGIVKSYSYAMTEYVLIDNPSLSYGAAIRRSSQMMKGKRWSLFLLDLSFIGWLILSIVTLEIGLIFLMPYWQTARAHFYKDLCAHNEATLAPGGTGETESAFSAFTSHAEAGSQCADVMGSIYGHEYVDLGLSVKWATCNLGADSPEDCGDYYKWGKRVPISNEPIIHLGRQYEESMGDIAGNPSYDAARLEWGGTWRLPTKAECQELVDKCTWTWTTQDGFPGCKIVSKKNGNAIFLPAAGWHDFTPTIPNNVYVYGDYWSSTPSKSNTGDAYCLIFGSEEKSVGSFSRVFALSVRPVSE